MRNEFWTKLHEVGIVPVIKITDADDAEPLGKALLDGGLPAAEITFRSDAAEAAIRTMAQKFPALTVCAGTVLDVETARRAVDAGAKAVISPGTDLDVVRWCVKNGVPVIPGIATPSEVQACLREGLEILKLFPVEVAGGTGMLKALAGPFPGLRFMPTGGVRPSNVKDYLHLKNVIAVGGTWIVPGDLLAAKRFGEIENLTREAAGIRDGVRAAG